MTKRRVRVALSMPKIPYSPAEMILFKFIPKNGSKITSLKLTEMKVKCTQDWGVVFPQKNVTVTMRHLMKKVRQNREAFIIEQSDRRGPHPVEYWIEMR